MVLRLSRLDGEIFAHFVEALLADAFDGQQIINASEGAVGFAGVEDFLCGGGADAGDLFQFGGRGGVDVDGMGRWLLFCGQSNRQETRPE